MTKSENTFEKLFLNEEKKIIKLAISIVGNEQDALDVVQDVFIRAYSNFDTLRDVRKFKSWIYAITLNAAKSSMKRSKCLPLDTLPPEVVDKIFAGTPNNTPENIAVSKETRFKCLHSITECLPHKQRIVFCLSVSMDLPRKTVANILKCSEGSVRTTLYRAYQRWGNFMKDKCGLISPNNPCRCVKVAQFSLDNGLVAKPQNADNCSSVVTEAYTELVNIRSLVGLYETSFDQIEKSLVERIQAGLKSSEWSIFSDEFGSTRYYNLNRFRKYLYQETKCEKTAASYYNALYKYKKSFPCLNAKNLDAHIKSLNSKKQISKFQESLSLFCKLNNIDCANLAE